MLLGDHELALLKERFQQRLGTQLYGLLSSPSVTDVCVNPDASVWVKERGRELERRADVAVDAHDLLAIINTTASLVGVMVNHVNPILEARVPGFNWRLTASIPPIVSSPLVAIRKPAPTVFPLRTYVENGLMSDAVHARLCAIVEQRRNALVVGGTGSGKTTLLNALLHQVATIEATSRVVILESTPELDCACAGAFAMETFGSVTMQRLLHTVLRLYPSRIVVGEVRGAEALTMIKAFNTGHEGCFATVHANSARAGLMRLEQMAAEGAEGRVSAHQVVQAIHDVVFITERDGRRRVAQVVSVDSVDASGIYQFGEVFE